MLIKCPECEKEISDKAEACPHCGHAIAKEQHQKNTRTGCLWAIGIIVGLAALGSLLPKGSPSNSTSDTAATPSSPTVASVARKAWQYTVTPDAINGGSTKKACVESHDEITQDFPYHNVTATLCIRKAQKSGLDAFVYLNGDGQVLCENYEGCSIQVRFDNKPSRQFRGTGAADHSTNIVFFNPASSFLARAKTSQTAIIQLRIYQHGDQTVTFNTATLKWQ